jgi:hypothetical protein
MTIVRGQLRGRLTPGLLASIGVGCIHQRPPTRRPVPVAPHPAGDTGRGRASAGVRAWTGWRTATAEVSGGVCGRTAPVPGRPPRWPCRPETNHAHLCGRAVACDNSVPGASRPAVSDKLHVCGGTATATRCPRW